MNAILSKAETKHLRQHTNRRCSCCQLPESGHTQLTLSELYYVVCTMRYGQRATEGPYLLVFRALPLVIDQIGVGELTAFGVFSLKIAQYERQPMFLVRSCCTCYVLFQCSKLP